MIRKNFAKKRIRILAVILALVCVLGGFAFYESRTNVRVRMLCSVLHFMTDTLEDPSYLLYDVDIMELCRDYGNGDTTITGKLGLSGIDKVKSSIFYDVKAERSFSQKRLSADMNMSLLWVKMGDLSFYAEDETVYMLAPLLGDDIGYAFPTGQNLFMQMPDLTSDVSQEWFRAHLTDIVQLMGQISIEETGETIEDEDGTKSEEFVVTIPQGCGDFIWELLGMDAPDYDVVTSVYLTKNNHMCRMYADLSNEVDGASAMVDGENVGTAYLYYELPDDERVEMKLVRNVDYSHRIDAQTVYYANTGKNYEMNAHIVWKETDDAVTLKVTDLTMSCDGKQMAKGYFKGEMAKAENLSDVFDGKEERLYNLEVLDWKEIRDDTESFVNEILSKTSMSVFVED